MIQAQSITPRPVQGAGTTLSINKPTLGQQIQPMPPQGGTTFNNPPMADSITPQPTIGGLIGNRATPGGLVGNIGGNEYQNRGAPYGGGQQITPHSNPNLSTGGVGGGAGTAGNITDYQNQVNTAYQNQTRRLDPMFAQQENALRQRMVDQGLDPNSAAFQSEMSNFSRGRNDAYNSAGFGAQQFGLQAYDTLTGHDLQREGYQNNIDTANIGASASRANARTSANASMYGADLRNQLGNAQLNENGRQFDSNLDYQYSGLNEGARQFDVNDIFRTNQQDIDGALGFGQLGLAQDQLGLQAWQAQNGANNDYFNQIGALFGNAPGFNGFNGSGGLIGGAVGAGQAQAQQNNAANQQIGNMIGAMFSSSKYKDLGELVDNEKLLKAVNKMPVFNWVYNSNAPTDDRDAHIGTTSEQFYKTLEMPEKDRIDTVDLGGALTGAIQALTARVEELEGRE